MSSTHPAHRIGSYEGNVDPETYLGDCQDLATVGVQSCRADLEVVLSGAEEAEAIIRTLKHAEGRLDKAKNALRGTAKIPVGPLDTAKFADLTETYTRELREAVKAARAETTVTKELVGAAQTIARISRDCHVLAERLVPALSAYVENQEKKRRAATPKPPKPASVRIKPAVVKPPKHAPANGNGAQTVDEPTDKVTDAELDALTARDAPAKEPDEPLDIEDILGVLDDDVPPPSKGDTRITKA